MDDKEGWMIGRVDQGGIKDWKARGRRREAVFCILVARWRV